LYPSFDVACGFTDILLVSVVKSLFKLLYMTLIFLVWWLFRGFVALVAYVWWRSDDLAIVDSG
jgi:hypothetical protein